MQASEYRKKIEIIWADMDPNQHMRHTCYSQYAAHARISFFDEQGYSLTKLANMGLAAVLLREQSSYQREVYLHEKIEITVELIKSTKDFSRYSIIQNIYKENQKLAAKVIIDGTWIDIKSRKITLPFEEVIENVISKIPVHKDFEWVESAYYRFS
jgi:acyl-CoA thioester hydrolase